MPGTSRSGGGAKVGVLSLQGAWRRHADALEALGAAAVSVCRPEDLAGIEALVIPGGESTTISHLLATSGMTEALAGWLDDRRGPVLGTCAGMILLAAEVVDGRPDQVSFAAMDLTVVRNGFGRQRDSFETDLVVTGLGGEPFPATFIRAPVVTRVGSDVEVLAEVDGHPVLCRQGPNLAAAFHPELSADIRIHQMFLSWL